jgi:hypothetical protein
LIGCRSAQNSHFVRRCTEKSCRMIWNRDVNATINMITIAKGLISDGGKPRLFRLRLPKTSRVVGERNASPRCEHTV